MLPNLHELVAVCGRDCWTSASKILHDPWCFNINCELASHPSLNNPLAHALPWGTLGVWSYFGILLGSWTSEHLNPHSSNGGNYAPFVQLGWKMWLESHRITMNRSSVPCTARSLLTSASRHTGWCVRYIPDFVCSLFWWRSYSYRTISMSFHLTNSSVSCSRFLEKFMLLYVAFPLIWLQNWGMSKKRREELPEGAKGWHARYLLGLWAKHHWCIRCHDWQLPLKHAESCWALWLSRLGLLDVTSDDLTLIGYAGGVFSVHLPVKGLPVSRTGIQDGWQF